MITFRLSFSVGVSSPLSMVHSSGNSSNRFTCSTWLKNLLKLSISSLYNASTLGLLIASSLVVKLILFAASILLNLV